MTTPLAASSAHLWSTTRRFTPARANPFAHMSPAGPAPMMRTSTLDLVDMGGEWGIVRTKFGSNGLTSVHTPDPPGALMVDTFTRSGTTRALQSTCGLAADRYAMGSHHAG